MIKIIAEAGVNHCGDLDRALKMVEAAAVAGADCVKFQSFKAEKLVSAQAQLADYQKANLGAQGAASQLAMLKELELSRRHHEILMAHCRECGIEFLSTAFDADSMAMLAELGQTVWKIPSGEVTNYPFLVQTARMGGEIILSTGMCSLEEVEQALQVLQANGAGRITLLHCTTEYPAPLNEVNLRAMAAMGQQFGMPYGYSDHTQGISVAIAAAALGASVIEKHFTLSRKLPGPDHKASLEPHELKQMVAAIREVELALGTEEKEPSPSEMRNRTAARKSIVAARPIAKGELFTEENLTTKRPGSGLSPMLWQSLIGKAADRNYLADQQIVL